MDEMDNLVWCGKYSLPFGVITINNIVKNLNLGKIHGELFRYSDTYSEGVKPLKKVGIGTTAPFSLKHWVGFFSLGILLEVNYGF